MKQAISDRIFSVEEYIQYELTSEKRHEFINGQLFEMAGEKDINLEIATELLVIFRQFLKEKGYKIYRIRYLIRNLLLTQHRVVDYNRSIA